MPQTVNGELWIEGVAVNREGALADAILNAREIPVHPGAKFVIHIDTVWEDDEGNFHAKIFFREIPQMKDTEDERHPFVKAAHDHILDAQDETDDALRSTEDMEEAIKKAERDFAEAVYGVAKNPGETDDNVILLDVALAEPPPAQPQPSEEA
jgi:hypothetical protein